MRISIITFSKKLSSTEQSWINTYEKRLKHFCNFEILRYSENKNLEAIFKKKSAQAYIIALDEKGPQLSSKKLADKLNHHCQHDLYFIIGGSYGLPKDTDAFAQEHLSLSKMTLPHRIALLVLTEQIYRAFTIQKNLPYHHN
ncbi:MAG TPA: 23S rRNA (pseudouridine(1915)-N(3))-methyltransferase RlmH [Oligoflexia bacterium]|nr:23S rRNA (pseudouridine(1915)-N(3))-methyltransferase RlmH [Oligoflexia bacterium]HMR24513.1 23S rRNA (pseudouridine(1915)-N(3))-methyltransferase RlmH [Oligoflexia bacterium]